MISSKLVYIVTESYVEYISFLNSELSALLFLSNLHSVAVELFAQLSLTTVLLHWTVIDSTHFPSQLSFLFYEAGFERHIGYGCHLVNPAWS